MEFATSDFISLSIVDRRLRGLEEAMSEKLCHDSSSWGDKCCIFRVPLVLKRHKREAYEPNFVSIGPFHHGGKQFEHMENVKQWYLSSFLSRTNVSLKNLFQEVAQLEESARGFYAEPLHDWDQCSFVLMMILDGCFVIELFRKFVFRKTEHVDGNDPIFRTDCMFQYLCHDLLLLENQLPWFVLEHLYNHTLDPDSQEYMRFLSILTLRVFTSQKPLNNTCNSYLLYAHKDQDGTLHILDLIRKSIVFPFQEEKKKREKEEEIKPFFWRLKIRRTKSNNKKSESNNKKEDKESEFPPVTALVEAGVKFQSDDTGSILNIEFEKGVFSYFGYKRGIFKIPRLSAGQLTDPLFRNLIAFEQCYHYHSHEITSYAFLMDKLVASSKDMEFLCEKGIIDSWLSAEEGANYFRKLCSDTVLNRFCYDAIVKEWETHSKVKWYLWLDKLNRDYFGNPWSVISLIAAVVLLGLTMVQTVYTVRSS